VRAVRRPEPADCGCFGAIGDSRVTGVTVWRNALLVVTAALAVLAGVRDVSLIRSGLDGSVWAWVAACALAVAVAVLVAWRPGDGTSAAAGAAAEASLPQVDDDGEYVRHPVPRAAVLTEKGDLELVDRLTAHAAYLLVFLNPGCGPCGRIGPDLEEWERDLDPIRVRAVLGGAPYLLQWYEYLRGRVWFDPHALARDAFDLATPSAVLIGADGLLAGGPVSGEEAIREFVAEVAEHLADAGAAGEDAVVDEPSELVSDDR